MSIVRPLAFLIPLGNSPLSTPSYRTMDSVRRRSKRLVSQATPINKQSENQTKSQRPSKRPKKVTAQQSSTEKPSIIIPTLDSIDHTHSTTQSSSIMQQTLLDCAKEMSDNLTNLKFHSPVTHVYNPLEYAFNAHQWYIQNCAKQNMSILLVGMNPGPWGMAQTGIPFGEVNAVRDFIKLPIDTQFTSPKNQNPSRPVTALQCKRSEVSGRRLWIEWASTYYKDAATFFDTFYVYNYCPLMWMEKSGRNRTPVQLPAAERKQVEVICDNALQQTIKAMNPKAICGIGGYAAKRCTKVLENFEDNDKIPVFTLLHPSPASPAANKGWVDKVRTQLQEVFDTIETK